MKDLIFGLPRTGELVGKEGQRPRPIGDVAAQLDARSTHTGSSERGFRSVMSDLFNGMLAAGALALVVTSEESPSRVPASPPATSISTPKIRETGPLREKYEIIARELDAFAARKIVPGETPDMPIMNKTDLADACKAAAIWAKEQRTNLHTAWSFALAHRASWPDELHAEFEKIVTMIGEIAPTMQKLGFVPGDEAAIADKITKKLTSADVLTCGAGIRYVAGRLPQLQNFGSAIPQLIAKLIASRLRDHATTSGPNDIREGAAQAGKALLDAMAAMRTP